MNTFALEFENLKMKRIKEYKKLFNVEGAINLKELKTTYRGLVKTWHPDKFQDEEKKAVAEIESTKIIDGYHTYEYFGVNRILFGKFVNAKSINNFGKRNIFNSFIYRKSKKAAVMA